MEQNFGRETWSVQIPEGWTGQHDPECATIVGDRDVGALQISVAFKDTVVFDTDLREFAEEHLEAGAKTRSVQLGDFVGFAIAFSKEDSFWKHWYLRNGKQALLVTYICSLGDRGVEDAAVNMILSTLSVSGVGEG